jgi:hypothetical protein
MSKRFTDTEIWDKEWFMDLSPVQKCLVRYVYDKCDAAGIYSPNFKLASLYIGQPVTENDLLSICCDLFEKLPDGKIWIVKFIKFQYGELSENCKPHLPIIKILKENGLFERVLKGYTKGIHTLKDKEKEKVKEKDKEKEKERASAPDEVYLSAIPESWNKDVFLTLLKKWIQKRKKKPDQDLVLLRLGELVEKYPNWIYAEKRLAEAAHEGWYKLVYADKEDLKKKSNQNGTHDPSSSATFHFDTPAEALKRR